jgi:flavin-dependent thymidylate synthase
LTDDLITDHPYHGELKAGASCQYIHLTTPTGDPLKELEICARQAMEHADPGPTDKRHLIYTHPHEFVQGDTETNLCTFMVTANGDIDANVGGIWRICGYPERLHSWADQDRRAAARSSVGALVRKADAAQYERAPMPDAARKGPTVTLIDAPVDPLGTLAVIGGMYTGQVARSKAEVTDEARRQMLADMQKTVLDGPLEAIQFTFLVEGVSRAITHQMVRNRFSFFAQESLRFAVAEDWAQEVPLPPSLSAGSAAEGVWRKALNAAEDSYNALIGAGVPAEEARGVLPHAITTRLYWTVSLRTLLQEAGKRTCTQAQFDWRQIFGGVAKALRERAEEGQYVDRPRAGDLSREASDGWQYRAFADLIRPVCYQQGRCGFMAKFDRGCTLRERVDAFERIGVDSSDWGHDNVAAIDPSLSPIDPAEWAADPTAARTVE